ncbi:hypothetical protein [Roseateles sp. LYH14W]|uniref:Nucleotidyl transferase AbiEii/AbiGii toxin family protein n=1 Tax=Pelomonas parva TaxID=3299032 RepID=A0ABW7F728_9BURK
MSQDPNVATVELAAAALGDLMDELVLVGGCAVSLLITDTARPPIRQTVDVDLLTEVAPLSNYYALCGQLKELGFVENDEVICRWQRNGLKIDVMPTDENVLNFTNSWYAEAAQTALKHELPSGRTIRLIAPAVFVATKLESFASRGNGDFVHHDLEDIINLVDGRPSLVNEVHAASPEVLDYIRDEFDALLINPTFDDRLIWLLGGQSDRKSVVLERMRKICGL